MSDDFVRTNVAGAYDLKKFRIPPGTVLPAGSFKVFYERDFRSDNTIAPFALSESGESVYLSAVNSSGALLGNVMGATFGASDNGVSIGRYAASRGGVEVTRAVVLTVNPIRISLARLAQPDAFEITVTGQPYGTYVIEASTDPEEWNLVKTSVADSNGVFTHVNAPLQLTQRFYRARPQR